MPYFSQVWCDRVVEIGLVNPVAKCSSEKLAKEVVSAMEEERGGKDEECHSPGDHEVEVTP